MGAAARVVAGCAEENGPLEVEEDLAGDGSNAEEDLPVCFWEEVPFRWLRSPGTIVIEIDTARAQGEEASERAA